MEKELTTVEIREMFNSVLQNWEEYKKEIHLSAHSLYNLISLKKRFEEEYKIISEALIAEFTSNDCPMNDDQTGFKIPPEKMDTINQFMNDFSQKTVVIKYEPIKMTDQDSIPAALIESFFDFIVFE